MLSAKGYFITGTDTGIGKTYVGVQLLKRFQAASLTTLGLKPLASGCILTEQGLRNEDALRLQQAATHKLPYQAINPVALLPPIAPHIAATQIGIGLTAADLLSACQDALSCQVDKLIVEGVGGWLTPLNSVETMADFAKLLNLPVILVVGIRLGCLNHALLTWQSMQNYDVPIAGWIANCLTAEQANRNEQIDTLAQRFAQPPIMILPFSHSNNNI